MAMADTTPGKIYDIAEKLGYEGARTQSSAKGVYACADALGFVGPHARRITDALSDLKTVVSGGGVGGSLGSPVEVGIYTSSGAPLGASVFESTGNIAFLAAPSSLTVPSGFSYSLGNFGDSSGTKHNIASASDVSATISYDEGQTTEAFTDYEIVENMFGLKEISMTVEAITTPLEVNPLIVFIIAT